MNKLKLMTVLILQLVIFMPFSSSVGVAQTTDTTAPVLSLDIPDVVNSPRVNIKGTTEANAEITVYVNGVKAAQQSRRMTGTKGIINIGNVGLTRIDNSVEVRAKDLAGNEGVEIKNVKLDTAPPVMNIINFIEVAKTTQITINGNVNELTKVEFYKVLEGDLIPPETVSDLSLARIEAGLVELSWDESEADDFLEYVVYRNDEMIGTTKDESFSDDKVISGQKYRYRVAAVDTSCNKGVSSRSLPVPTAKGNITEAEEYPEVKLSCELPVNVQENVDGSFTQELTLDEGFNKIKIIARDAGGNTAVYENVTLYDSKDPVIESDNLNSLSPSYISDIHVTGKISEKATVFVYINGKKSTHWGLTDDEGKFRIGVKLKRDISTPGQEKAWINRIQLKAVDLAGREVSSNEVEVKYAMCGFGTDFSIEITDIRPDVITPRDVVEEFAQFNFNLKFEYDPSLFELRGSPNLRPRQLSDKEKNKADTNLNVNPLQWSTDGRTAVVSISIDQPVYPQDVDELYEKEDFIAENRKGECGIPELGCYKFPLMLEIRYDRVRQRSAGESTITGQLGPEVTEKIQKNCIDVQVGIQPRINVGEYVNKKFIRNRVMDLENTIEFLDKILEPLDQIYSYLFYACVGTMLTELGYDLWTEVFEWLTKKTAFDRNVARVGLCDQVYDPDKVENEKKSEVRNQQDNCNNYATSVVRLDRIKRARRHICDRVFCTSAPTLKKYIKDQQKKELKPLKAGDLGEVRIGSDCGNKNQINPDKFRDIETIYSVYEMDHDNDGVGAGGGLFHEETAKKFTGTKQGITNILATGEDINCAQLHPSAPACCGYEYMIEYGSVCDLPGAYYTTFNEIKESYCIAATQAGEKSECDDLNLRTITNTISGICTPEGGKAVQKEIIPTGMHFKAMSTLNNESISEEGALSSELVKKLESAEVYILISPQKKLIKRGYVGLTYKLKGEENSEALDAKRVFIPNGPDLSQYFKTIDKPNYAGFQTALCSGLDNRKCTKSKAKTIHQRIQNYLVGPENEHVVDPTSGFLRTMQCLCLPGFIGYVRLWRNILQMSSNCLQQIEATGHGSEGACESFLTTYLCDFLWDIIKCVYYAFGNVAIEAEIDIGMTSRTNIISALVKAGEGISSKMTERYGETSMFESMFTEKKLVNSMCKFAFTGTFEFDMSSEIDQATQKSVPINSQALIAVAERRFNHYDIASMPSGQAAYGYRIAGFLNAGADLDYTIKLKCSADMSCSEAEGYKVGRCDCVGIGEKEQPIKQGKLSKFEIFDEEILYPPSPTPYRYDKAVIEWAWKGQNDETKTDSQERTIQEVGGAPSFCSFSVIESKFLCSVGPSRYYAKFTGNPVINYPIIATPHFGLNNQMTFTVPLHQTFPAISLNTGGSEHTKYLIYELYNQKGIKVATNNHIEGDPRQSGSTGPRPLDVDKVTPEFRLTNDGPLFKVIQLGVPKPEYFGEGIGVQLNVIGIPPTGLTAQVVDPNKVEQNLKPKFGQPLKYTRVSGQNKFVIEHRYIDMTGDSLIDTVYGIRIESIASNTNEIILTASDSGASACTADRTEAWTVRFAIHEAIENGAGQWVPSNQVSIDLSGTPQRTMPLTFSIKCDRVSATTAIRIGDIYILNIDYSKFKVVDELAEDPARVRVDFLSGALKDDPPKNLEISTVQTGSKKLNVGDEWTDRDGNTITIQSLFSDKDTIYVSWTDPVTKEPKLEPIPTTRLVRKK